MNLTLLHASDKWHHAVLVLLPLNFMSPSLVNVKLSIKPSVGALWALGPPWLHRSQVLTRLSRERLFFQNTPRKLLSVSSNQRLSDILLKHLFKAKEKPQSTCLMRTIRAMGKSLSRCENVGMTWTLLVGTMERRRKRLFLSHKSRKYIPSGFQKGAQIHVVPETPEENQVQNPREVVSGRQSACLVFTILLGDTTIYPWQGAGHNICVCKW